MMRLSSRCVNPTKLKAYANYLFFKSSFPSTTPAKTIKTLCYTLSIKSALILSKISSEAFPPIFINNSFTRGGCPEVTKMISQYPELVNVIVRMSSSRGVSHSGSKHALIQLFANVWPSDRESCLRERLATKIRF